MGLAMKKLVVCVTLILAVAACGVKPSNVKPPSGARDIYPSTYPYPDQDALNADKAKADAAEKAAAQKENQSLGQ
jgi:hypothetical protein